MPGVSYTTSTNPNSLQDVIYNAALQLKFEVVPIGLGQAKIRKGGALGGLFFGVSASYSEFTVTLVSDDDTTSKLIIEAMEPVMMSPFAGSSLLREFSKFSDGVRHELQARKIHILKLEYS